MKTKVCHVTANLNYSLFIEAIAKFLDREKYDLSFVFLNPKRPVLADRIKDLGIKTEWIKYRQKRDLPRATFELIKYFRAERPDIVHTHLVDSSLAGLSAALFASIKGRVHTRHHGSECHTYYRHGVYYDKYVNRLSKRIMAITGIVRDTLVNLEGIAPEKISTINYGYDLNDFAADEKTTDDLREKYGLKGHDPIVGVISRFVHWKGVQYVIPAFVKLLRDYPDAKLVMANAVGHYSSEIDLLLKENLRPEQFVKIEFESRVFDLYKTFDVFIHVPIGPDYEAFGQTYIEPLYLGIPSIFTLSGIANDFIEHEENALVVPYCDSSAIYEAAKRLLQDRRLREKLGQRGPTEVVERFSGTRLADQLDTFYHEALRQVSNSE